MESQARLGVTALGYCMRLQVPLMTADGEFAARVDGLIDELGVVVEVDGRVKYVGDDGHGSVEAVLRQRSPGVSLVAASFRSSHRRP